MKRVFLTVIGFYWITAVAIPMVYIFLFDMKSDLAVTTEYRVAAAIIMTAMLFFASLLIIISKESNGRLQPTINDSNRYVEVITIVQLVIIVIIGGGSLSRYVNENVSGALNGTFFNYLSLFIEVAPLIVIRLFSEDKKKNVSAVALYVLYTIAKSSRSGIMYVVLFYICARMASSKFKAININRLLIIFAGVVSAPFVYVFTSSNRGFNYSGIKMIMDRIIERLSCLDLLGRVIRAYEEKDYLISLFNEKFSLAKQLQMIINAIVPGDIFESDVMANQYHRAIFSGYTVEWAQTNYMSINLTLPGYLLLKYSIPVAVILGAFLIFVLYKICAIHKNSSACRVIAITGLWELIYFFDWSMVFVRIERIILTVFLYYEYRQIKENGCIRIGKYCFRVGGRKRNQYAKS